MSATYRVLIGMEVHLQIATKTKLFCGCENRFGAPPNSLVCPVCLGFPGALPVLNREALRQARRLAFALGADVATGIAFDRKHYFYPDLPKGYQITQYTRPIATGGTVPIDGSQIPLVRLHLEEDAAASAGGGQIDMNRAGVPLVEIVSHPALHSAEEAVDYVRSLREIAVFAGVSDAEMSRGNLRAEPNVNLVIEEGGIPTPIAEVKNLNSLANLGAAITFEIDRQWEAWRQTGERGGPGRKTTRGFDPDRGVTVPLRGKEEAEDYRYFPDPDLPPLLSTPEELVRLESSIPDLPRAIRKRFVREFGLPPETARILTATPELAAYFAAVVGEGDEETARTAAGLVMTDVLPATREFPLAAARLGELSSLVATGRITRNTARRVVWPALLEGDRSAEEIVAELDLAGEAGDLASLVREAVRALPAAIASYRMGKDAALGPVIKRVLEAARGRADPRRIRRLIEEAARDDS